MHLPEVGRELGLLVASARYVLVGRDDLPPRLQADHGGAFNGDARLPAPLPARLLVEAHAQQLHLEPLELVGLRRRDRGEEPAHRVQRPIGVVAGEALLVGPPVAVAPQLADEAAFRRTQNPAKYVVPGLPHQLEQSGHVPRGRGLVGQHRVLGVVAELEGVEPARLQGGLDLAIDERAEARLEQVQGLADSFVIGDGHVGARLSVQFAGHWISTRSSAATKRDRCFVRTQDSLDHLRAVISMFGLTRSTVPAPPLRVAACLAETG